MSESPELLTSGTLDLEPVRPTTLVADQITAYLKQEHKSLNEAVLNNMLEAFKRAVTRQLMSTRDTRKGYESCTVYSGPCARKSRLQFDGVVGEPIQARSVMKFLLGDLVELAVIGVAQLAGVDISHNNANLFITGTDGAQIPVHPDGLLRVNDRYWNLEVKSCDSRTFDHWLEQGGPDDTWGYQTQRQVEESAWEEHGLIIEGTCFVAVSTGSRQGSVAEWLMKRDSTLVTAWQQRRDLARGKEMPPVPFQAEDETEYKVGKMLDADYIAAGAVPRQNVKGAVYGWDIPTGRKILPLLCSYCAYKGQCWPGVQIELNGGKPIWVVSSNPVA